MGQQMWRQESHPSWLGSNASLAPAVYIYKSSVLRTFTFRWGWEGFHLERTERLAIKEGRLFTFFRTHPDIHGGFRDGRGKVVHVVPLLLKQLIYERKKMLGLEGNSWVGWAMTSAACGVQQNASNLGKHFPKNLTQTSCIYDLCFHVFCSYKNPSYATSQASTRFAFTLHYLYWTQMLSINNSGGDCTNKVKDTNLSHFGFLQPHKVPCREETDFDSSFLRSHGDASSPANGEGRVQAVSFCSIFNENI